MKRIAMFMSVLALAAVSFMSCDKNENGGDEELILDGFYVYGEATCLDRVTEKGMFAKGLNEADGNAVVGGLWEKYVALEGGKTFVIAEIKGGAETKYGAGELETETVSGSDYSIDGVSVTEGTYVKDATFSVETSGLYHVIVYVPKSQVTIIPVSEWSMNNNGVEPVDGGEWVKAHTAEFNKERMSFSLANNKLNGAFKFQYGNGWKYVIDADENVKVNTNFGADALKFDGTEEAVAAGGADIKVGRSSKAIYTSELIWKMERGLGFSAKFTKTGTFELPDPATYTLGLIGSIGGDTWTTDIEMTYIEGSSWKFVKENLKIEAGAEFKVRSVGTWSGDVNFGYNEVTITGDSDNFQNNGGNIKAIAEKTYSKITLTYDGPTDSWTLDFAL